MNTTLPYPANPCNAARYNSRKTIASAFARKLFLICLAIVLSGAYAFAQAPSISYSGPQTYTAGTAITPLAPANTGGAVPAIFYGAVTTLAGSGAAGATNGTGTAASFNNPFGTAVDAAGNVYVADFRNNLIREISPAGAVTTLAGSGAAGRTNGTGTAASFSLPADVAVDAAGNVYVADYANALIRKISPAGVVTTLAGSGTTGSANGTGTAASFYEPTGVTVDAAGNVYVADAGNNLIREISPAGVVTTLAGGGAGGSTNGTGTAASFYNPNGVAVDAAGNVYVAEYSTNLIRKISPAGAVTTLAGSAGISGSTNGTGTAASFAGPSDVAIDAAGNVYVTDQGNQLIRKISPAGVVTTLAGTVRVTGSANATGTAASFNNPFGVSVDAAGNLYVADLSNNLIRTVVSTGYSISPALPAGLSMDNTGTISGTPTAASPATTYTITAYNGGGSSTATLNITVNVPPAISSLSMAGSSPTNATSVNYTATFGSAISGLTAGNFSITASGVTGASVGTPTTGDGGITWTVPVNTGTGDGTIQLVLANATGISPGISDTLPFAGDTYTIDKTPPTAAVSAPSVTSIGNSGTGTVTYTVTYADANFNTSNLTNSYITLNTTGTANGTVNVSGAGTSYTVSISGISGLGTLGITVAGGAAIDQAGNADLGAAASATFNVLSSDATLSGITLSAGTLNPTFSPGATGGYTVSLSNGTPSITLTPTTNNASATATVNGQPPSTPVTLVEGSNPVSILVTAQDGTQLTYTITVNVAPSSVATLSNLTVTEGKFTPAFSSGTTSYTETVGNSVTSQVVVPTASVSTATITVNGRAVASGTASRGIALSVGQTTITTVVKAQDNSTTATYTITITRLPLPPTLSYSGPDTYTQNTAIPPLTPVSSGVAAPAYRNPVVLGSGFSGPTGVAVDAAGDLFIADYGHQQVKEIAAGTNTPVAIGSGFTNPFGVAVDAAGDVYVADYGANAVYKIPAGNPVGTGVTIGSGFINPTGVAIDAKGNVYVADHGNNAVKEIPVGNTVPVTIGSGFSAPVGIAVDASGNVYVGDRDNEALKEIPAGSTTPITVGPEFGSPYGVAVDPSGNIFINDYSNNALKEIPAGTTTPITIATGFNNPKGVATDGAGNIYVADYGDDAVKEIKPVGGYYINASLPASLTFNNTTGVISGTPAVETPATNYTITAYNGGGSATATVNITVNGPPSVSYSAPPSYSEGSAISPLSPTSSNVAAPAYNSVPVILSTGYKGPTGVAADAAGDVFIADYGNSQVKEITAGSTTPTLIGSGFTNPFGVAVDAAGDVYVADYGANAVYKIPAGNGAPVTIGSGFSHPTGVAIDAAGNVYIADHSNNAVKKIPAGSNTPVKIGSGFNQPVGIAVDAQGNVYVGDRDNNAIKEIPVHSETPVAIGSGFSSPYGVAVDASGNVFVADYGNNAVKEIPAGSSTPVILGAGFKNPEGVAIDGAGNVYVADQGNNAIKQIKPLGGYYIGPFLPAGLSFSNTTGTLSGTPTVSSPATNYTVTAYNAFGSSTANLNIAVLSDNANLTNLVLSSGPLTPAFSAGTTGYTANVANSVPSVTVTPTTSDPNATVTVNTATVTSGTASASLPLSVGGNTITTVVTAQSGKTKTYILTVVRAPGSSDAYQPVSVVNPTNSVTLQDDGIVVHQGVSPNGDGINDFLQIDNITNYPDNKLMIMNRNGQLVYEASGYNNSSRIFDGHSNKNGQMQLPGTYFYQLAYTVSGIIKYKTGFLVLKY